MSKVCGASAHSSSFVQSSLATPDGRTDVRLASYEIIAQVSAHTCIVCDVVEGNVIQCVTQHKILIVCHHHLCMCDCGEYGLMLRCT